MHAIYIQRCVISNINKCCTTSAWDVVKWKRVFQESVRLSITTINSLQAYRQNKFQKSTDTHACMLARQFFSYSTDFLNFQPCIYVLNPVKIAGSLLSYSTLTYFADILTFDGIYCPQRSGWVRVRACVRVWMAQCVREWVSKWVSPCACACRDARAKCTRWLCQKADHVVRPSLITCLYEDANVLWYAVARNV